MKRRTFSTLIAVVAVVSLLMPAAAFAQTAPDASPPKSATSAVSPAADECSVNRVAGQTRYDTAVEISQYTFTTADTVIIATGENWPDALSGAPLAADYDAPLLLTLTDFLPDGVKNEITRLGASHVIILGGPGAVTGNVQGALQGLPGVSTVERLAGSDRYGTASAITGRLYQRAGAGEWTGDAFIATGANFPDALGASAIAAATGKPILLTLPNLLPPVTSAALTSTSVDRAFVLGGTGAVSANVETALKNQLGQNAVSRLWGPDRYATTVAVVQYAAQNWGADVSLEKIGLSSGVVFPDALAAGAALGRLGRVQLLTTPNTLAGATEAYMTSTLRGTTSMTTIFGGTGAVSANVASQTSTILCPGGSLAPPAGGDPGLGNPVEVFALVSQVRPQENTNVTVSAHIEALEGPLAGADVTITWDYPAASGVSDVVTQVTSDATGFVSDTQNAGPDSGDDDWVQVTVTATWEGHTSNDRVSFNPTCSSG